MEKIAIIRYYEIALKKGNRFVFENVLCDNIRQTLHGVKFKLINARGRIFLTNFENEDIIIEKLQKIPGISSFSIAKKIKTDLETIKSESLLHLQEQNFDESSTFRVETNRVYKKFPLNSLATSKEVAEFVLSVLNFKVNLTKADIVLGIEIYENETYIFTNKISGLDGLPVKSSGKLSLLLSGGIDSPVAGFLIMKRGIVLNAVYFHSSPYTSEAAKQKVIDLATILSEYQGNSIDLFVVPFTDIQKSIQKDCFESYATVFGRRYMVKIANIIAKRTQSAGLVTGDSIGQVSSQTLDNIASIEAASELPIIRPLIAMDKIETIKISKEIKAFDISIRPFDDCCVLFAPKNPVTKSKLEVILSEETKLSETELIENAVKNTQLLMIRKGTVIKEIYLFNREAFPQTEEVIE